MEAIYIHGIGFAAPGLPDWESTAATLRSERAYQPEPLPKFRTALLPRNESRRAGNGVNMAFRVAEAACAGRDPAGFAAVFASSAGDIDIADWLCAEVNTTERAVSPTRFHNSVHNAASGYWSLATGSREVATSLSGGAAGFVMALRETWGLLAANSLPVLLVCYDVDGTGPLHASRPDIGGSCSLAWLLDRGAAGALARLSRPAPSDEPIDRMDDPRLEALRHANPTARSLPLLAALAQERSDRVVVESKQGNIGVDVTVLSSAAA